MQIRLLQPTIQLDVVGSLNRIDLQRPIGTCKRPILEAAGDTGMHTELLAIQSSCQFDKILR